MPRCRFWATHSCLVMRLSNSACCLDSTSWRLAKVAAAKVRSLCASLSRAVSSSACFSSSAIAQRLGAIACWTSEYLTRALTHCRMLPTTLEMRCTFDGSQSSSAIKRVIFFRASPEILSRSSRGKDNRKPTSPSIFCVVAHCSGVIVPAPGSLLSARIFITFCPLRMQTISMTFLVEFMGLRMFLISETSQPVSGSKVDKTSLTAFETCPTSCETSFFIAAIVCRLALTCPCIASSALTALSATTLSASTCSDILSNSSRFDAMEVSESFKTCRRESSED
mmetsp:Transcript_1989/g.7608  ORF Transcript_1989/g.7608 Transcript_1989/m.7608 type:complete len:281 (-) Transcript_1989:8194-9036(-)